MSDTPPISPTPPSPPSPPPPARELAALLSFLVPGLGQILQGLLGKNRNRLTKGVFFLVALLGMFFVGMWLGKGKNVYVPHVQDGLLNEKEAAEQRGLRPSREPMTWFGRPMPRLVADVYTRLQYAGQFWIGVAAWPALWNYYVPDAPILPQYYASPGALKHSDEALGKDDKAARRRALLDEGDQQASDVQFDAAMGKRWDIGWVYTVIAGVLNILVIYDAYVGPVPLRQEQSPATPGDKP